MIEAQLVANKTSSLLPVFSYFNLNEVETKGIEFNTTYKPFSDWEIKIGYQLLYAYDKEVSRRFETEEIYANDINGVSFKLNKQETIN